jgi:hypothetical protein
MKRLDLDGLSEIRLVIHPWPDHTTLALTTRTRRGSENWDRREHSWDIPLPEGDYSRYRTEDQLWMVLAALAATLRPPRLVTWAEPPEPPDGGYRGDPVLPFPLPPAA